jgi:hypothetical protein
MKMRKGRIAMKRKISGIINIVAGAFLLIALQTYFKPCQGKKVMICDCSAKAVELLAIIVIAIGIAKLFLNNIQGQLALNAITLLISVEWLLIPTIIGTCQMASMACNTKTFPVVYITALLLIVLTIIFEIADFVSNKRKDNVHNA